MRQGLVISVFLFALASALAQEVGRESYIDDLNRINSIRHILREGETISEVLEEKGHRNLYQKGGPVDQTFWKNGIKKSEERNLAIGLKLTLPYHADMAKSLKVKSKNKGKESLAINKRRKKEIVRRGIASLDKTKSEKGQQLEKIFFLNLAYGVRYFSVKQTGALGNARIGITTPHYLTLKTGLKKNEMVYYSELGFGKFKMKSSTEESSEDLMYYSFGLKYKDLLLEAGINQLPLFRNNAGSVEMTKLNTTNVKIGYGTTLKLNTQKETSVNWEVSIGLPLSGSSSNSDVKVKKISGHQAQAKISFEREISKNKKRQISYFFKQEIQYNAFNINTDWDVSKGSLEYKGITSSFQVGLKFEF